VLRPVCPGASQERQGSLGTRGSSRAAAYPLGPAAPAPPPPQRDSLPERQARRVDEKTDK